MGRDRSSGVRKRGASRVGGASGDSWLADAGELLADHGGDDAVGAHCGASDKHALVLCGDAADEGGFAAKRMGAEDSQGCIGGFGSDDEDGFALVGDVDGIEAEEFAGGLHLGVDGQGGLVNGDADVGRCGDFIQCGGEAAAGGVAHGVDIWADDSENAGDEGIKGGAVRDDQAFELEALADAHDGHAVIAEGAGDEDGVAGLGAMGADLDAGAEDSDAGGVDVAAVAVAALDDLGVSGDDLDARCGRGLSHGGDDGGKLGERETFFKDEAGGEIFGFGSGDGEVVDGSVDGEIADGAAGEKERLNDEGVAADGDAAGGEIEDGGIAEVFKGGVAEGGEK